MLYRIAGTNRKYNVEIYTAYPDGGPYCVSWFPIKKADFARAHRELKDRGLYPMRDSL